MIFDCHTHRFSPTDLSCAGNADQWLSGLDDSGVTHAVVLPYAGLCNPAIIRRENDAIAALCASRPERLVPFFTVNLHDPASATSEFARCVEQLGGRGLKIHPWLQGASINTPTADALCEMAGLANVPILLHDGTPCFALPSQVAMLAKRHPNTRIILGHCGLLEYWRESIDALNSVESLWGCICGPHLGAVREILRCCDHDRLVWGSDFGFVSAPAVGYRLELLRRAMPNDGDFERIVQANPLRLFPVAKPTELAAASPRGNADFVPRRPAPPPKWLKGDAPARKDAEPEHAAKQKE